MVGIDVLGIEIEIFWAIVLVVFQRIPVDRPEYR